MGTAPAGQPASPSRLWASLPAVAFAAWFAGAVALWAVGQSRGWAAGEFILAGSVWLIVLATAARDAVRQAFGPVFAYEILRLGRRRWTFVLRGLYVAAAAGLFALMYLSELESLGYFDDNAPRTVQPNVLSGFAARFFYAFQVLQFAAVLLLTPAYVAAAVADEKERKTLEFLLATDLRNHEIVFGKLAARVATLLMYVLVGLPILAFLQLFGGIDPELLLAGTAASVVTVVGLSAWSICLSVLMKRGRDAIAMTYLTAVVYAAGSAVVGVAVRDVYALTTVTVRGVTVGPSDVTDWLAAGNVGYLLGTQASTGTGWVGEALGRYTLWWGVVTAGLLAVAVGRLRTVALQQAYGGPRPRRWRVLRSRRRTHPAVGDNPVFWKEVFVDGSRHGGAVGWLVSFLILALVFCFPLMIAVSNFGDLVPFLRDVLELYPQQTDLPQRWKHFTEGMSLWVRFSTGAVGALALLAAAIRGAATVTGERDRDTWVSLVSTPLTTWEMLAGKWWGCVLGLRRIYSVLIAVWAIGLVVGAVHPVMVPVAAAALAVYVTAFAWLGVFCSVTARTTLGATVRAIMAAVFLGGGFWLVMAMCCIVPVNVAFRGAGGVDFIEAILVLLLGGTPPFTLGWLPLPEFERQHMGPFAWNQRESPLGPFTPLAGLAAWAGFACVMAWLSWVDFRRLANRHPKVARVIS